jgi:hypothetical protein
VTARPQVGAQRAHLLGRAGHREVHPRLLGIRRPRQGRGDAGLREGAQRLGRRGEARQRAGGEGLHPRARGHTQRDLGEHPERALRSDEQLAQVRPGGGGGQRAGLEGAGRRRRPQPRHERVDPAVARGGLAGRAGGDPAADGGELEGLRQVAEREVVRGERRLRRRPVRPAWSVARRERASTSTTASSRRRSSAMTAWWLPRSAATPPTTLVPPPKGTTATSCSAHAASSACTSSGEPGVTTASGAVASRPERSSTRSG